MTTENKKNRYGDILHLQHPTSRKHPRMPVEDRASQFAPFAALTGHDAAISETARLTEERRELDEDMKMRLNETLWWLKQNLHQHPEVEVEYFQADTKKQGGAYLTARGCVRALRMEKKELVLEDRTVISLEEIREIRMF